MSSNRNQSNSSNESGKRRTDSFSGGFLSGLKSGFLGEDVDAFKNIGRNTPEHSQSFGGRRNEEKSSSGKKGLDKKDGLDEKDGLSKNEKDSKSSSETEKSKDKPTFKDKLSNTSQAKNLKQKWKSLKLKIKIGLICAAVATALILFMLIIAALSAIFDTFVGSMSTFFGISSGNSKEDSFLSSEEYIYNDDGDFYTQEELVEELKSGGKCSSNGGLFENIKYTISSECNNACDCIKYIDYYINKTATDVDLDRGLIVSTLIYGYGYQTSYTDYKNPLEITIPDSTDYYSSLEKTLENSGGLVLQDIRDLIDNSYTNVETNYYQWEITTEKDEEGNVTKATGACISYPIKRQEYSLTKWKIFMRFGSKASQQYDKYANSNAVSGAFSEECNGKVDKETLQAMVNEAAGETGTAIFNEASVDAAVNAYNKLETGSSSYLEKAADTESKIKDTFDEGLSYKNGFVYNRFPQFKQAIENSNSYIEYDSTFTPKYAESIIQEIVDRKVYVNEVLGFTDLDAQFDFTTNGSVTGAKCMPYLTAGLQDIQVRITDCDGVYQLTTDFKDYIMGVAYGEIGSMNEDYVKTQMVAAASYALNRRENYTRGTTINMKTGNCDQVYCSLDTGCYSKTSRIDCGGFRCTSFIQGGSRKYHGIASAEQKAKYSEWYDEASNFLLVSNQTVFASSYIDVNQRKWEANSNRGMSFTEILEDEYGPDGATLIQCTDNTTEDNETNSTTTSDTIGNEPTDEYPNVSPNRGKYYGYAYNDDPVGRNITINPVWIEHNLEQAYTNCPEANWTNYYRVNKQAVSTFENAYANICKLLTTGVTLTDGSTCKLSVNDLQGGGTFEPRKTTGGDYSLESYGLSQKWNYAKVYNVNNSTYRPYTQNSSSTALSNYNMFIDALGKEEDCRNVNYILAKYAYIPAGFTWGGDKSNATTGTFNPMEFYIK